MQFFRHVICACCVFLSTLCWATPPVPNLLYFENEWSAVTSEGNPWLELIENEKTREIRLSEHCSAIGGPSGRWRVQDGRLWLVGLLRCGGNVPLESVYGGSGDPIFAEWINTQVVIERGKTLCLPDIYDRSPSIQEFKIVIKFERGLVSEVKRRSNLNDPSIPTVADLRKIFGPNFSHLAEELHASGGWHCPDEREQKRLRNSAPEK